MKIHDLIGIGFGPSNISLAIALKEKSTDNNPIDAFFIEKKSSFSWHPNMLLDQTHMQISYLKDLATLRNPQSSFTFINYLHEKKRLSDFINLSTFYPSRHEFNDYLSWAAQKFDDNCAYGEEVFEVLPQKQGDDVTHLLVRSKDANGDISERLTRNLVVAVGGTVKIPENFTHLKNDPRVFHSHQYLQEIDKQDSAKNIAIIGAGQSAAELFVNLHGRATAPKVDMVIRSNTLRPADSSPFVNEVFNVDFTDYIYNRSTTEQKTLIKEFWQTNYACPDLEIIENIFDIFYQQKVVGNDRHTLLRSHEVTRAEASENGITLTLTDLDNGQSKQKYYDAVILATGYNRQKLNTEMLAPISQYLGDFSTDRNYQISSDNNFKPGIFLQGESQATHGLSDTLLSVIAVRAEEIYQTLIAKNLLNKQEKSAVAESC
jgi:lysine N6-hydroxylase/L-ornithine N5-oxygenase